MRRWVNPSHPQMLQIAVIICYIWAVFTLVLGLEDHYIVFPFSEFNSRGRVSNPLLRLTEAGLLGGGAYLMANGKRLGWYLALAGASLPLVARLLLALGVSLSSQDISAVMPWEYDPIGLVFEIGLLACLVHPQSREYQRIWLD